MAKRWISAILVSLLLTAVFSCGALAEEKTPKEKLIDDLMSGLGVYERLYGNMYWALEYVEIYDVTRRWGDLQIARTALNLVLEDALALTPPVQTLTEADQNALLGEGIDASFIAEYGYTFKQDRNEMLDTCINYNWNMLFSVFERDNWKHAVSHMRLFEDYAECYLQYSAITVDWLTTQTDDAAWIDALNRRFAEKCPLSSQRRLKSAFNADDAMDLAGEIALRLQDLDVALAGSYAENKDLLYQNNDAYEDGNLEQKLEDARVSISDLPALVPEAAWDDLIYPDIDLDKIDLNAVDREDLLAQDRVYLWKMEDGALRRPEVLDALDAPPDACAIVTRGVSREDVEDYCAKLELTEGIRRVDLTGDSETLRATFQAGESLFVVAWEANVATIDMPEAPVCFAPDWYVGG